MVVAAEVISVDVVQDLNDARLQQEWRHYVRKFGFHGMYCDPRWMTALREAFQIKPYFLQATEGGRLVGVLPLAFLQSMLFGRFLVSLPYLNWAGVMADSENAASALIDQGVRLADGLDVRHLQLRQSRRVSHPSLRHELSTKAQMHLELSPSPDETWKQLRSEVRTQIRKGRKQGFTVEWGDLNLVNDFYHVFAHNMRDLGTPVFDRRLFQSILANFSGEVEICLVRSDAKPIGGAIVVHGPGLTEVPSASVLRAYRATAANSLMYWHIIERAIERRQDIFDFGRSTIDSPTYVFKKKWGATPRPAVWQYYVRKGDVGQMRPESPKYRMAIRLWQRLPVALTKLIGPPIVRGIP